VTTSDYDPAGQMSSRTDPALGGRWYAIARALISLAHCATGAFMAQILVFAQEKKSLA